MSSVSFFENVFPEDFCKFLLRDSLENLRSGREMWRSNLTWDPAAVSYTHLDVYKRQLELRAISNPFR